jgi:hypothetical protein
MGMDGDRTDPDNVYFRDLTLLIRALLAPVNR